MLEVLGVKNRWGSLKVLSFLFTQNYDQLCFAEASREFLDRRVNEVYFAAKRTAPGCFANQPSWRVGAHQRLRAWTHGNSSR